MKDIGYYCDFLDDYEKRVISDGELSQLSDLLIDLSLGIHSQTRPSDGRQATALFARYENLSDLQQIQLIRGLCDRIELKLMETAN